MDELTSKKISIFMFFASIAVCCQHCNALTFVRGGVHEGITWIEKICYMLNIKIDLFNFSATSFFFMSSAFLLYRNICKENIWEKIKKRCFSLGVPFLLWNFIAFLVISPYRHGGIKFILTWLSTSEFNGPMWFVEALLLFLISTPVNLFFFRNRKLGLAWCIIVNIVGFSFYEIMAAGEQTAMILLIRRMLAGFPVYVVGGYLGVCYFNEVDNEEYRKKSIVIVAILLEVLIYTVQYIPMGKIIGNTKILSVINLTLMQYQFLFIWVIVRKKWCGVSIPFWCKRTFFTYGLQWIVIYYITLLSGVLGTCKFRPTGVSISLETV